MLWWGPALGAPACPDVAPAVAFEGHADLTAPPATCGACSCLAPSGSCAPPATVTANAASCALTDATTPHTAFDPVPGWAGACDDSVSIPAGKLCSGTKCVQSVTVGAPTVLEGSCEPVVMPVPKEYPSVWATFARACSWTPHGVCDNPGTVCSPAAPAGFRACVVHDGEVECPAFSPYGERHVFYDGIDDTRTCSPCTCGAPAGSSCSALVSLFADAACSTLLGAVAATSTGAACVDVPAGSPLGGKTAAPTYAPGTCPASGGEPQGAAVPTQPVTFCCAP